MKGRITFLPVALLLLVVLAVAPGCTHHEVKADFTGSPGPGAKIKVVDVSNDTGDLFDVDVIGLMWGAIEEALQKKGLLWTSDFTGPVLEMEVHIVKYQASNVVARNMLPFGASTLVAAQYELKNGGVKIASLKSNNYIAFGGSYRYGAWRKIFLQAAEDLVKELKMKLPS
jgi:hypothetical protein